MTNEELRKALIDAAQAKNIKLVMSLVEQHQPDFSHDDFNDKAFDIQKRKIQLLYKQNDLIVINGNVQPSLLDGYILVDQSYQGEKGNFVLSKTGAWTYTITNAFMLEKISNAESVLVNELIEVNYYKNLIFNSVAHIISAYVAYYGSDQNMQTLLNAGICPNLNNENSQKIGRLLKKQKVVPNEEAKDSRALLNAVKQNKGEMVNILINHNCPCCNGAGAKVTTNIINHASDPLKLILQEKLAEQQ